MNKQEQFWEKVFAVGTSLKVSEDALKKWRFRGYVPSRNHYRILSKAESMGVEITHEELNREWK